ncbi:MULTISPECIES: trypsin-like peptidase domain-containing protein [unclassified Rhodococcus (in: high G+C Gram-positive bacteria)]|uniref:trypsin-like peptidase domain-containing protein n=1 Tax=unclassified Rhodococcus (in: high G+C Gram-positive bacteria) TaxID=192944 RepID=UPI00163AC43E|nr:MULTISPECIES: trypsin-like peptidase domain-containing protein [unclassified Rhodococcus (in: high G+C Gram-positive bacteria)]MBC2643204.1 trypsin-like peptidase domain-containing protein [Rhodococcus sp. 3A]MBC2892055.1 trypsin-like peptidase domain-containing protein [Rhodococcus sp. 4CII]
MTADYKTPGPGTTAPDGPASEESGTLRPADAPRLDPRPVYRPNIDAASSRAFGRPGGVTGSFAPSDTRRESEFRTAGAPDPVLAEAFGRPEGETDTIQRDPHEKPATPVDAAPPADPWRDPAAGVELGSPALHPEERSRPPAPALSAREVLFGGKVAPKALVTLGGLALAIGLVGGLLAAVITADRSSLTSRSVTLVQGGGDEDLGQSPVARVADAVLPAVVSIQVAVGDQGSTGSGVVIDGAGYIVTNNHVISAAATAPDGGKIQVIFSDGTKADSQIVGRDIKTDLAVLKVSADNLTVAELGKSGDVQVGEDVVAVGSPLGLSKTVTRGIVSALHRPMRLSGEGSDTNAVIDAVQTDAAINHGNSGGALVDDTGRVIGINTAMLSESGGSVGLGFAIPIDDVTTVAQTLIRDGQMHHPDIGVNARTVVNDNTSGAQVANVRSDSPAARAGVVENDVIVKVGDRTVTSADELVVAVNLQKIGEPVRVQLIREGRLVDVDVTPASD